MKKWFIYIGFTLFLIGIIMLFGFAQNKFNHRKINTINVTFTNPELKFLNQNSVNNLLIQNVGNPLHQLNSTINLHELEEVLCQNKMTKNVRTYLTPEGSLTVNIEQRQPLVRVKTATSSYYIDNEGKAMPLSDQYTERVPIATGIYQSNHEQELYKLMQHFSKDSLFKKQVIGLNRLTNGDYQIVPRVGNYVINFGKTDDIEHKIKKLKIFYKKMWNDPQLQQYNEISLKYKNQVVCSY